MASSQTFSMLSSQTLQVLSGARCSQITHSLSRKCGPGGGVAAATGASAMNREVPQPRVASPTQICHVRGAAGRISPRRITDRTGHGADLKQII